MTAGTAPLVGISSYAEPARWGPWQLPCALLPLGYAEQVAAAGGVPVLLPPLPGVTAAVGRLDALILSGGGDLDPAGYGAAAHPETTRVQPGRDRAELDLLATALAAGLPVLGICRGLQIINTARGGTLEQHLPDGGGHRCLKHSAAPGTFGTHPVRVAPGSRLASLLGPPETAAASGSTCRPPTIRPSAGWATGWWPARGPRTAPSRRSSSADRDEPLIAVQWHPEQGTDPRLFRALIKAARHRLPGSAKPVPAEPLDSPA